MFSMKSSCFMGVLLVAITAVLTHAALQSTDSFPDNAIEEKSDDIAPVLHKRPSFFVGSRYGRSGGGGAVGAPSLYGSSKTRRLNVVPRNDRFFLGSRYGKRAGEYISPYEQDLGELSSSSSASASSLPSASLLHAAVQQTAAGSNKSNATPQMMSCVYTGLKNLYRCSSIEEINNIINQLTTAHNDDDDDDQLEK